MVSQKAPVYPFGLDGPFTGLTLSQQSSGKDRMVVDYHPNEKQLLAHNACATEILYGGALFGGKSWWLLHHNALHCLQYGNHARTIIFRRIYDDLERSIIPQHRDLFGKLGTYKVADRLFQWSNGAKTWFRHLEREDDVKKHDSAEYTLIVFDELTHFLESQYLYMWQRLRASSRAPVHCQIISASNPGGIGHKWVYERFIHNRKPYVVYHHHHEARHIGNVLIPEGEHTQAFILAVPTDNVAGLENNPNYLLNLAATQSPEQLKAKVAANWEAFMGLAFPEWDENRHVIEPFTIPQDWKVIRCGDWGISAPFYIGWLAQDPESRAIYLIAEWYGRDPEAQSAKGIGLAPAAVHDGIIAREQNTRVVGDAPDPWYGVLDPACWQTPQTGGSCVADLLNGRESLFNAANNNRLLRKAAIHSLLRVQPETGKYGFYAFKTCTAFIDQMRSLQTDPHNPEDVDTKQEDHAYDGGGYGIVDLIDSLPTKTTGYETQEILRKIARIPAYARA